MRDTSGHRQPLHTFSPIAVRATYYPTISIQFDHPHYHFIANISLIPTWGIISVKYTHYGRLLWAALLIILAHMDNGSSKKKQKKKSQSRTMGPLGISCTRAASPARPSLAAALSSNSPAPGFLNAIPISLEGMSAWAAKVFTNNKVYYVSIPKMSFPGLLLTCRVGQQANCCRATYYEISTRWQLPDSHIMDISSKKSAAERKAKDSRHSWGGRKAFWKSPPAEECEIAGVCQRRAGQKSIPGCATFQVTYT